MKCLTHCFHQYFHAPAIENECVTPEGTAGNCINFRFCSVVVNMIIQNQQNKNDTVEAYIKKSICGYEGNDPKVCCPGLIFAGAGTTASTGQPGPFIFSSVNSQTTPTPTPNVGGQPTFSPLNPTPNNPAGSTNAPNPNPNPIIFSSVGSSSVAPPTQPTSPSSPGPIINRLPTNDVDKCGVSTAIRSRIVG